MAKEEQGQKAESLMITRMFNAPRERVWRAWTEPEMIKKWWGPRGYTMPVVNIDLRVGGKIQSCMRSSDGKDIWSIGTIKEIVRPERLVITDSFADAEGYIVPASTYGMPGDWALELLITVKLEEQEGKTKLIFRHDGFPDSMNVDGARKGWGEMFDKLTEYLEKERA